VFYEQTEFTRVLKILEKIMRQPTKIARRKLLAGLALGVPAVLATASPAAWAFQKKERHPRIRGAIRELREAKKELETAAHDFGGHRVEAVEAINVAIKQLEKALEYDKK
jgi:hypothetical protein